MAPIDFLPTDFVRLLLTLLMTTDQSGVAENSFAQRRLPWLMGAGALLGYLITLNHWVSLASVGTVARTAGWLWQPEAGRPLTLAVFFPFRSLPEAWLPLALNLFTAVCASFVLVQLARSVALLRYEMVSADPFRQGKPVSAHLPMRAAWMPPLLAVLVCGLQLTFWENAASATGEMISLLCFAYAIRCLLEFRVTENQSWLSRCACVYAAGMADHWMLVGYFPVLVATILWIKGLGPFLELRFLLRMMFWGLVGLSLYLLLPTLLGFFGEHQLDFGTVLHTHLKSQKQALILFRSPSFRLLLLTALLPPLLLAVRWRSHTVQFADDTRLGVFLLKAAGHSAHALFFAASLWIALNPAFTPQKTDLGMPMLAYHYLWALVAGYAAGYFLLFGSNRSPRGLAKWPARGLAALIIAMPLVLLWKNLGELRATNSPAIHDFARELYEDLPMGQSAVLSEDPKQLLLLRAELARHGHDKDAVLIETPALLSAQYHQFMARQHGTRWPDVLPTNRVEKLGPANLLALISRFAAGEPVMYLHPSSGFFFEKFADEPHGSAHRLVPRPTGEIAPPPPSDQIVAANEQIWQARWAKDLDALTKQFTDIRQAAVRWSRPPFKWLRLAKRQNTTVSVLGAAYSKSLNYWGVQARRAGHETEARDWFRRAIELNPDNLSARINLEYTARLMKEPRFRFTLALAKQQFPDLLSKYESWWEVISQNGPVDEPTFLLQTGRVLLSTRNPRQAADAFARSAELLPDWLAPKLWQAQSFNLLRDFTKALALTDRIQTTNPQLKGRGLAQLLLCRTTALRQLGRTNEAAVYLEQFLAEQGTHNEVLAAAASLRAANGQFQQELELRETLLQRDPNNAELLARKGLAELRLGRNEPAIATLTRALTLSPGDANTRLLRAVAYLSAGQLDASKTDYQELLRKPERSQSALFGLGGIAWREHDTNAVIQYYQQFLSNSAAMSPQFNLATERLRQLSDE